MSDQDTISLCNINTVASGQVRGIKKKTQLHVGDYKFIQYQILQTDIKSVCWQTGRRITNEILRVKGLTDL